MDTFWAGFGENWTTFTPTSAHTDDDDDANVDELKILVLLLTETSLTKFIIRLWLTSGESFKQKGMPE